MTVTINGTGPAAFDSSGNLGVGTASPSQKLDVYSSSAFSSGIRSGGGAGAYAVWNIDGNNPYLILKASGTEAGRISADSSNNLTFYNTSSATERMRIDSSGNLLLGTTSTVDGSRLNISATWPQTPVGIKCSNAGGQTAVTFWNGSSNVGRIDTTSTATSYVTSSDYRLKENIQPMQNALSVVQQLNPVTYKWKADGSEGQGFIAHELQAVVPDCVTGEKDAVDEEGKPVYQGIDTSFLVATLTKAIQEQQAQIETLTAKVAALETK